MERSRYQPQKNQIKSTKRYLRESESGCYKEFDEEAVTPSRKGRMATTHETKFEQKGDNGNRTVHMPEYEDYVYYKRSSSRADSGHLGKSKKKLNLDINNEQIIYKERLQESDVDTSVKEPFEKPKKVHFQMRESKSTPLSVRVKAIKQKYGNKPSRYYTASPYQDDRKKERHGRHIPDLEGGTSSNDEDFKYSKHSDTKPLDGPRHHTGQHRSNGRSKLRHPVELDESDISSDSEPDLDFYNKPYCSRRLQTQRSGKYSLHTSVPDNLATTYNHIPSRIPRPASGMSGLQKSALKKSSSFDSRAKFSVTQASRLQKIPNNENSQKIFEEESIHLERHPSSKTRSQAKKNTRYSPSTPGSHQKPVKNTQLIDDFESEISDGNSTDESEPVEPKYRPSQSRTKSPANHDNCYPIETFESDSDEAFEQIEVYVPRAVFKHASRQIYDLDQDYSVNTVHERPVKEYKFGRIKNDEDYLEKHDRSYKQSQNGKIYRMPIVVKRPESRSNDHSRMRRTEEEHAKESRHRPEVYTQRERKQMEDIDDVLIHGRRHYHQSNSHKNASVENSHSYRITEIDDTNVKLLRKAEDSHRMFMSVWLPPRTSNGGFAKPKRSILDTPEHLFMLRRIVKRT